MEDYYRSKGWWRIINPFLWLVEGVRTLIALPFWLAYESGWLGYVTYFQAERSPVVSFISFIVPILSLVVAIIANWKTLQDFITGG